MALTINTNIKNDADGYSLDAKQVKGTLVVISSISDRNNIPSATLVEGSVCFVSDENKFYTYISSSWVEGLIGVQKEITSDNKLSYDLLSGTPTIPTKTTDLTNDSGFITKDISDLTNYYNKTTSDSKYELADFHAIVVAQSQYETETIIQLTDAQATIVETYNRIAIDGFNGFQRVHLTKQNLETTGNITFSSDYITDGALYAKWYNYIKSTKKMIISSYRLDNVIENISVPNGGDKTITDKRVTLTEVDFNLNFTDYSVE